MDAVQKGQEILLGGSKTNATFEIIFAPPTHFDAPNLDTSIHPMWYESYWHVIYAGQFRDSIYLCSVPFNQLIVSLVSLGSWDQREAVHNAAGPLRTLTPGGGAYQNEVRRHESLTCAPPALSYLS